MSKEHCYDIKTFFFYPDKVLMPEDEYLKMLLLLGFEVYYINGDRLLSLESQVDCLVELFGEIIIFVNIESKMIQGTWKKSLEIIKNKYQDKVKIGVLHREGDPKSKVALEKYCLINIGIQCGCIFLSNNQYENTNKLRMVLEVNEANGRRKVVRAECFGRFNFMHKDQKYEGKILNISTSYFLGVFTNVYGPYYDISESEKIKDIQIMLCGGVCHTDAVLIIKRTHETLGYVYVFHFVKKSNGRVGLDKNECGIINNVIFEYLQSTMKEKFMVAFRTKGLQQIHHLPVV